MVLFLVTSNPRWRPAAILENFEWPYLRNAGWSDTLYVWFFSLEGRVFTVGGWNCAISGYIKSNPSWRQAAILDNFEWPYLRNGSFHPLI